MPVQPRVCEPRVDRWLSEEPVSPHRTAARDGGRGMAGRSHRGQWLAIARWLIAPFPR
jgi:hypothetical protein